jgi:HSP20 family protein
MTALTNSRWGTMFPKSFDTALDINQLFDAFFANTPVASRAERSWFSAASLSEAGDCFYVDADIPGVKREDVEVTLEKNVLRITAERKAPSEERTYWHNERGFGRIERTVTLPETVDPESIEAELSDGVLHIKLQKRVEALPKKIEIRSQA